MVINDMYFHGVSFVNWEYVRDDVTRILLLESILKDGFILNKQSLGIQNSFGAIRTCSWNKDDAVCICNHSCRDDEYVDSFNFDVNERKYRQSAFDVFVCNDYSIILDNSILNDYNYFRRGMIGEYQVFGNISLSYIRGIGVPNYIQRMLDGVEDILAKYDSFNFKQRLNFWVKKLENIENLDEFGGHFFAYI